MGSRTTFLSYLVPALLESFTPTVGRTQQRDYTEFCKSHIDLVRELGDGRGGEYVERQGGTAAVQLDRQVDLYDFVLWETQNAEFVNTLFPVEYHPFPGTIPRLLVYKHDRRVLPHAKEYFRSQIIYQEMADPETCEGWQSGQDSAQYLLRFGWDDKEAIQMVLGALRRATGRRRLAIAESALYSAIIDTTVSFPIPIRNEIITIVEQSRPEELVATHTLSRLWNIVVMSPPEKDELLGIFRLCMAKTAQSQHPLVDESEAQSRVKTALDCYPKNKPFPPELLDALENYVKTGPLARDPDAPDKMEYLLGRIKEHRKRQLPKNAQSGATEELPNPKQPGVRDMRR